MKGSINVRIRYVVFTLNRSFYPTTSVHPVSVLIHPREIHIMWSDCERKTKSTAINQGKARNATKRTWYENTTKQARPEK